MLASIDTGTSRTLGHAGPSMEHPLYSIVCSNCIKDHRTNVLCNLSLYESPIV
jgi:hypothetical protein